MEEYIGVIKLFAGNYEPQDYRFCDGRLLPIQQYNALFAVLGFTYGGDGKTTFALPDLRGRTAIGAGQGPGLKPRKLGEVSGSEGVTLNIGEMPTHSHYYYGLSGGTETNTPTNNFLPEYANTGTRFYSIDNQPGDQLLKMNEKTIGLTGASQAHNNMQPYNALNYIICVNGLFPPHWN